MTQCRRPRRCTFWAGPRTTHADAARFLKGDRAARIHVIEEDWLARISSAELQLYRMPPETFTESIAVTWPSAHTCRSVSPGTSCQVVPEVEIGLLAVTFACRSRREDLPEVRAHALNNLGAGQQGTLEALSLLEQSIDLSARLNSPEEARGHHNLAVCAYMLGDVPKFSQPRRSF